MVYRIREAELTDACDIASLSGELGYAITEARILKNIKAIKEKTNEIIFVAVHEASVIGWLHVFETVRLESGSYCEIGGLVISAEYQQRGVGSLIVDKAIAWSEARGQTKLRVRCNVKRAEAHHFYTKAGFIENKEQKVFELTLSGRR
jgi:GNAT superfamily N-acetyltransferase